MALVKCKYCGNEISDQAEVCPKCGAMVKEEKAKRICVDCGKEIPDGLNYCTNCGCPLDDESIGDVVALASVNSVDTAESQGTSGNNAITENNEIISDVVSPEGKQRKGKNIGLIFVISTVAIVLLVAIILLLTKDTRTITSARKLANNGEYDAAIEMLQEMKKPKKAKPVIEEIYDEKDSEIVSIAQEYLGEKEYEKAIIKLKELHNAEKGSAVQDNVYRAMESEVTTEIKTEEYLDAQKKLNKYITLLPLESFDMLQKQILDSVENKLVKLANSGNGLVALEKLSEYGNLLTEELKEEIELKIISAMKEEIVSFMEKGDYISAQNKLDMYKSNIPVNDVTELSEQIKYESLILKGIEFLEKKEHIIEISKVDEAEALYYFDESQHHFTLFTVFIDSLRWGKINTAVILGFDSKDVIAVPYDESYYEKTDYTDDEYLEEIATVIVVSRILEASEEVKVSIDIDRINRILELGINPKLNIEQYK